MGERVESRLRPEGTGATMLDPLRNGLLDLEAGILDSRERENPLALYRDIYAQVPAHSWTESSRSES